MKETKEQRSWQNHVSRPQLDKALLQSFLDGRNKTLNPHELEWLHTCRKRPNRHSPKKISNRSKPWITDHTLELLATARTAEATGSLDSRQKETWLNAAPEKTG